MRQFKHFLYPSSIVLKRVNRPTEYLDYTILQNIRGEGICLDGGLMRERLTLPFRDPPPGLIHSNPGRTKRSKALK
jgi:hypothetical protein